jgi:hypothetical protein
MSGGNEYGQCGEEPERKDDNGRPLRRDIVIPQPCAPKLVVRQVTPLSCLFQINENYVVFSIHPISQHQSL